MEPPPKAQSADGPVDVRGGGADDRSVGIGNVRHPRRQQNADDGVASVQVEAVGDGGADQAAAVEVEPAPVEGAGAAVPPVDGGDVGDVLGGGWGEGGSVGSFGRGSGAAAVSNGDGDRVRRWRQGGGRGRLHGRDGGPLAPLRGHDYSPSYMKSLVLFRCK